MTAGARPTYSTSLAELPRDLDAIRSVWKGNFGPDVDHPAKILHLYAKGPAGPALVLLLRDDRTGEPAGVIGAIPRPMRYAGESIEAAVISHVAVAPRHRTLGPVLRLHAEILVAGRERFDLVYGHPNPRNMVILKRAKYGDIGRIARYVKVLRHGPYAARLLPAAAARLAAPLVDVLGAGGQWRRKSSVRGLDVAWSPDPTGAIDQVWEGSKAGAGLEAVRTADFLQWRFAPCVAGGVRYLLVSTRQGPVGWFACEDNTAAAGRLTVLDYRLIDMPPAERSRCLQAMVAEAYARGYVTVEIPLSGSAYADDGWRDVGFVERGGGPITGAIFDADKLPGMAPSRIHMTYLDNDS